MTAIRGGLVAIRYSLDATLLHPDRAVVTAELSKRRGGNDDERVFSGFHWVVSR